MNIVTPININDAALLISSVPENEYPTYSVLTTYAFGARVIVIETDSHLVYESIQAANINHPPATSPTWWVRVGADNRWRMFDLSNTSQTAYADSIQVSLLTIGRVNCVAAMNISAASVRVKVTAESAVVYDTTKSTQATYGITDWYQYFFAPVFRVKDIIFEDLPNYANCVIEVTLSDAGQTAACGTLIVGQSTRIGSTQYGLGLGIDDYSVKTRDDFGNYTILERAHNRKMNATVWVDNGRVDQVHDLLSSLRARPALYIADSGYKSSFIYGFYKDFNVAVAYPTVSACSIEITGLT